MISYIVIGIVAVLSPVIGYFMGAVRMITCFAGIIVAAITAPMISPLLKDLLPKIKITSPFWQDFFGPGIAFLLVLLVFFGISFAVHYLPENYFRTRHDEVTRLKWSRLIQRSGVFVGLLTGFAFLIATGFLVNSFGYSTDLFSGASKPKGFEELSSTRDGFEKLGLREISGTFDSTRDEFYDLVETIATIYNSPSPDVRYRLTAYPPFLSKIPNDSFYRSITSDDALKGLFDKQGNFNEIYGNKNVQDALKNMPIYEELKEIDLADLKQFVKTGKSEKYSENKVVGRWKLDAGQSSRTMLREMNEISRAILPVVRKAFVDVQIQLIATLDGNFTTELSIPSEKIQQYLAEQAQGNRRDRRTIELPVNPGNNSQSNSFNPGPGQNNPQYSQDFQNTYGTSGQGFNNQSESALRNQQEQMLALQRRQRESKSSAADPEAEIKKILGEFSKSTQGKWEKVNYKYKFSFGGGKTLEVLVLDGDLKVIDADKQFVFYPDI